MSRAARSRMWREPYARSAALSRKRPAVSTGTASIRIARRRITQGARAPSWRGDLAENASGGQLTKPRSARVERVGRVGPDPLDPGACSLDRRHLDLDEELVPGQAADAAAKRGRIALRERRRPFAVRAVLAGAVHGERPPPHHVVQRGAGL